MSGPLGRRDARPAAPVRHVHLGLGNFFRAHQAWYTERAPDRDGWGIAAFTGRSAAAAERLAGQQGVYTLVTRGAEGDSFDVIGSISEARPASDHAGFLELLSSPAVAVVTLTVTEAAYRPGADSGRSDLDALRRDLQSPVHTVPARLVAGLAGRRAADAGPLAIVPCDNLPDNGTVAREMVLGFAQDLDPRLAGWIAESVSFVSTVVDRITPRTTDADVDLVATATGRRDASPVVTEPFAEWALSGAFPGGRPAWHEAGAVFADDVTAFEQRKLRLLNGAHSLLAYAAPLLGHTTVADAIADPACRQWVEQWWDEAAPTVRLPLGELDAYRAALLDRFANPRVRHELAQIAADGSQKLPVRVVPVLRAERAADRMPDAGALVVAAWLLHLRGAGVPVRDADAATVVALADGPMPDAARRVLDRLDPELGADGELCALVIARARELESR